MQTPLVRLKGADRTFYSLSLITILLIVISLLGIALFSVILNDMRWMMQAVSPSGVAVLASIGIAGALFIQWFYHRKNKSLNQLDAPGDELQAFLRYIPGGVIVVDDLTRIHYINETAEDIFQYQQEELCGKKLGVLLPESSKPLIRKSIRQCLNEGKIEEFEVFAKRKGNIYFPALFSVTPLQQSQQNLAALMVLDGIDEQKEDHFARLHQFSVQQASEAILWMGQDNRILYSNNAACKLSAYSTDELEALKGSQLCLAFQPEEWKKLWVITKKGGSCAFETKLKTKHRNWIPVEIVTSFVSLEGREYICAYIKDITHIKVATSQLQQLTTEIERKNEELEQFSYIASHNLQEPLRLISSFAQILNQRYKGKLDADADEFIQYVVDGTQRMQLLLRDLSSYSLVSSRTQPFEIVSTQLIVEKCMQQIRSHITTNCVTITSGELPSIRGNQQELLQLFGHLISNAITYKHPVLPPQIEISAEKGELFWIFSVKDNGIGIAPEYHEQVFKMFNRLHARNEYEGTGVGLAICRKIVEKHGGKIWLESALNQGTTIYFSLPVHVQAYQKTA